MITALNANAKPETKARATLPNALYRLSYSLPGVGNGLTQLTFPMKIDAAQQRRGPNDAGHYYAMQFDVNDLKGRRAATGYIGLQPRQDGKALVAFSGFGKSFRAPSGIPSADGGPGASNATLIDFRFGHTYELTIERDAGDRRMLSAFVRDVTRAANPGAPRYVKSLRMDRDVLLAGRQTGFVEHYGKSLGRSSDIAYTAGTFHAPFGTSEQGKILHGSLTQGELHGRFQHSTLGHRSITTVGRRIVEVALGIRGAS
ncbi:hypothetical protein [Luteibacter sp. CQ10]|uniref:hypothetical protein n=1 Tax=Luteibacter sp. CQ10 TaxID=2805821 RepID=UPI0034A53777